MSTAYDHGRTAPSRRPRLTDIRRSPSWQVILESGSGGRPRTGPYEGDGGESGGRPRRRSLDEPAARAPPVTPNQARARSAINEEGAGHSGRY
jgi:hypothetical protein